MDAELDLAPERDSRGRFVVGNSVSVGNKGGGRHSAAKEARLHDALNAAVTDDALDKIVAGVVKKAEGGDPWAVEFLYSRLLGRPKATVELQPVVGKGYVNVSPDDWPAPDDRGDA